MRKTGFREVILMNDNRFKDYLHIVEENLTKFLPTAEEKSATVVKAMEYSLTAGGKRIRPVMLLAACEMAGGSVDRAVPFACAIEYIHTYSLIHDDLPAMDDDELRRGKPTSHVVFGEAEAILAGDALLNRAFEIMIDAVIKADETDRNGMLKAAGCIAGGAGYYGMIGGQIADIESERRAAASKKEADCSEDRIMLEFVHRRKTGALIKASVMAGAYIAGAGEEVSEDLSEFADCFGLEFQIADDILDVKGSTAELGKPVGSDEKNGKLTYPSCIGMEETEKYYEQIHKKTKGTLEKYGNDASFFTDLCDELYHRVR